MFSCPPDVSAKTWQRSTCWSWDGRQCPMPAVGAVFSAARGSVTPSIHTGHSVYRCLRSASHPSPFSRPKVHSTHRNLRPTRSQSSVLLSTPPPTPNPTMLPVHQWTRCCGTQPQPPRPHHRCRCAWTLLRVAGPVPHPRKMHAAVSVSHRSPPAARDGDDGTSRPDAQGRPDLLCKLRLSCRASYPLNVQALPVFSQLHHCPCHHENGWSTGMSSRCHLPRFVPRGHGR